MINTFVHSHSYRSKQNSAKTILFGAAHTHMAYIRVCLPLTPTPASQSSHYCVLKEEMTAVLQEWETECNRLHMYLDPYVPVGVVPKKWPFEVEQPVFLSLSGYNEPKLPTIPLIS